MVDEEKEKVEQETKEGVQEGAEPTDENRSEQQEANPIFAANAAAERLEKANKEMRQNLKMQQELYAQQKLGGKTDGGEPPKKQEDVDPAQYAKDALQGKIKPKE